MEKFSTPCTHAPNFSARKLVFYSCSFSSCQHPTSSGRFPWSWPLLLPLLSLPLKKTWDHLHPTHSTHSVSRGGPLVSSDVSVTPLVFYDVIITSLVFWHLHGNHLLHCNSQSQDFDFLSVVQQRVRRVRRARGVYASGLRRSLVCQRRHPLWTPSWMAPSPPSPVPMTLWVASIVPATSTVPHNNSWCLE